VPDAYPSLERIEGLHCFVLSVHGEHDEVVPASHARALLATAPEPKEMRFLSGVSHHDPVPLAGERYLEAIASWWARATAAPVADARLGEHELPG